MKISELLPVDTGLSGQVCEALSSFIYNDYALRCSKSLDIRAFPSAIRIIAAFAALEKTGNIEDFKMTLREKTVK